MHEPIVMLTYTWDMSERTRLNAATSLRFGKNGYSALTWNGGPDPRGDYYRYLPSYAFGQVIPGETSDQTIYFDTQKALERAMAWTGMLDFDDFYSKNKYIDTELKNIPGLEELAGKQYRSNYILEERHTDQIDYNFAASVQHEMRNDMRILGGVNLRANRTWYYDEIKDLMGGDYWYDIDKFAERDHVRAPWPPERSGLLRGHRATPASPAKRPSSATTTVRTCSRAMPGRSIRGAPAASR